MFIATSRRRSPSMRMSLAVARRSMTWRSLPTSSSGRSLVRLLPSMFAIFRIFRAVVLPIPWMYVSDTTTRFTSEGRWGTNGDCTKLLCRPSPYPLPQRGEGALGEYDRALFCDSDGVLKVRGQGAVDRADRPAVRLH